MRWRNADQLLYWFWTLELCLVTWVELIESLCVVFEETQKVKEVCEGGISSKPKQVCQKAHKLFTFAPQFH